MPYGHLAALLAGRYSSGLFVCRQPWLTVTLGLESFPTKALVEHVAERSAAMMQATAPATAGVAMDVPDMVCLGSFWFLYVV